MDIDLSKIPGFETFDENKLRELNRRLCYFATKGSQSYVSDLIDFLVLNTMSKLTWGSHHPREIFNELRNLTNFKFEYEQVLTSLERLTQKKSVDPFWEKGEEIPNYCINFSLRQELNNNYIEQVKTEKRVIDSWKDELKNRYIDLTDEELEILENDLQIFSLRVYSQHSIESVLLFWGDNKNITTLLEKMDEQSLKDILPERPQHINKIRLYEFPRFFIQAPDERKIYIGKQLNQIFILYMMQLDPKCASLAQKAITGGTVYLDTNFIIRLLGIDGPELQEATHRLLKLSQGLGYTAVVSPKTIEEYSFKLGDLLQRAKSLPGVSPEIAEAALSKSLGRDFYSHFWKRSKETQGHLSLQAYFQLYQDVESLLQPFNINIDQTNDKEIRRDKKALAQEMSLLSSCVSGLQYTHEAVIEHDAYHRLLILRLRAGYEGKPPSPIEVSYWFLTCDTKLPVYDRRARPRLGLKIPFCVLSSQWMQLLRPFATAVEELAITHADTLDSPLFRLFPIPPTELLQEIITRMSVNKEVDPKYIVKTITNDAFVQAFNEEKNEEKKDLLIKEQVEEAITIKLREQQKETEEIVQKFNFEKSKLIEQIDTFQNNYKNLNNKLNQSKEQLESYQKEKKELEDKIQLLQKNYEKVLNNMKVEQRNRQKVNNLAT